MFILELFGFNLFVIIDYIRKLRGEDNLSISGPHMHGSVCFLWEIKDPLHDYWFMQV